MTDERNTTDTKTWTRDHSPVLRHGKPFFKVFLFTPVVLTGYQIGLWVAGVAEYTSLMDLLYRNLLWGLIFAVIAIVLICVLSLVHSIVLWAFRQFVLSGKYKKWEQKHDLEYFFIDEDSNYEVVEKGLVLSVLAIGASLLWPKTTTAGVVLALGAPICLFYIKNLRDSVGKASPTSFAVKLKIRRLGYLAVRFFYLQVVLLLNAFAAGAVFVWLKTTLNTTRPADGNDGMLGGPFNNMPMLVDVVAGTLYAFVAVLLVVGVYPAVLEKSYRRALFMVFPAIFLFLEYHFADWSEGLFAATGIFIGVPSLLFAFLGLSLWEMAQSTILHKLQAPLLCQNKDCRHSIGIWDNHCVDCGRAVNTE